MANRRIDPVSYKPFQTQPLLSEGLLSVSREGGDLERKVAAGLARMADHFGQRADREAERAGELAGARAAMEGAPTPATITGGGYKADQVSSGVRVKVPPAELRTMIADAAVRNGVDPHALTEVAGIESSFNPYARNNNSSAGGLFQFVDGTAKQYGLRDRFDPAQASDAAARLMRDNRDHLRKTLGREPNAGELYLAHQQGAGGASKLLANPNARAVDVVGHDAVRLNGGSADMTAGQFAAKWTSKVAPSGGSYDKLPSASSVEPVSVTPVREELVVTPGKAGTFRPSGRDTVYGRAFDVKGTRTYLEIADAAMVQNQQAVFERYKDDPVLLEKALQENLTADLRDNVFEEIAPEYTAAYNKRSMALLSKARADQKERADAANRVEFLGRVDELENRKSQQLAGLKMDDDAAGAALADTQSTIDAHYDSAVARGVLTAGEAEKAKRKSRSDLTVGFYTRQAALLNADQIKTMRADMKRDYAAGKLEGVTADDWDAIDKGLMGAESARRTQDAKSNADLEKRGEDMAKRIARGLPVGADELARFQLDAGTAPRGKEIVSSTLTRMKISDAIRTQPIGEVEKSLKTILGENATSDDVDFARKAIADHRKDLQADPLGVAERFGVLPVSEGLPLDGDVDPAAVAGAFSERINASNAAGQHFGVSPRYFRPGEAEQIEAAVKADPAKGLAIAAGLVDAAGRDADRVLRELGETAPAVALSGGLIAAGGSRQAALDLISGYGKSPEGKAYTDIPNTKRIPVAQTIAGDALQFSPAEVNRLDEAAAAIARKRLYDAGVDPKKEDARPFYEKAYQEAAGATFSNGVQFGGFTKFSGGMFSRSRQILVPPSIRADKFGDLIDALEDGDVGQVVAKNGRAWTARDFQKATPIAVNGGYAFALGDLSGSSPQFIADKDGNPVVLDLAGMRGKLGARVPGAYR